MGEDSPQLSRTKEELFIKSGDNQVDLEMGTPVRRRGRPLRSPHASGSETGDYTRIIPTIHSHFKMLRACRSKQSGKRGRLFVFMAIMTVMIFGYTCTCISSLDDKRPRRRLPSDEAETITVSGADKCPEINGFYKRKPVEKGKPPTKWSAAGHKDPHWG